VMHCHSTEGSIDAGFDNMASLTAVPRGHAGCSRPRIHVTADDCMPAEAEPTPSSRVNDDAASEATDESLSVEVASPRRSAASPSAAKQRVHVSYR
jgi:hypothetical protein